jgi:SnoaL-like domain
MGTEENKAVVRRFIENVASGRDVSVADDVLAPGYVNLAFEGVDIAGLKAMMAALSAAVGEARTGSLELVAERDAVFARFDYAITLPDGSERTSRGLAYYHLTDGRIDVNDVMMMPDLHEVLRAAHGAASGPVDLSKISVREKGDSCAV